MWLEADTGSELPLTSFSITHPGMAAVKVLSTNFTPHPDIRETETKRERLL